MKPKMILAAAFFALFAMPLLSQTDFESALARHKGNKIVLLGEWKAADIAKWRQVIDADGVYEHGFLLLDRPKLMDSRTLLKAILTKDNIEAFDHYVRQRSGLSTGAKWAALDMGNKLILSGSQAPDAKDFDKQLDQLGIKSPLRRLRDFLREKPDHLDAEANLLKEVRRRALHVMPQDAAEDLGTEKDMKTWGVLAAETDKAFNGSWIGLSLMFFQPHKGQPEQHSPLMRKVFQKHLPKVEAAIRQDPINDSLWRIWAWMARSSPEYKWAAFFNSVDSFDFPDDSSSSPPGDVCVWVVQEARARGEWEAVIKYARRARRFSRDSATTENSGEWSPSGGIFATLSEKIDGYPVKSAYAPHIEALLRLGDIEGANKVYDEMIKGRQTGGVAAAVEIAKSLKMEQLVRLWEKGELTDKTPYFLPYGKSEGNGSCSLYVFAEPGSEFEEQFDRLSRKVAPLIFPIGVTSIFEESAWDKGIDQLGWKKEDGPRWALLSNEGWVLEQGATVPDAETMQAIYKQHNIISSKDFFRHYLAENGGNPGLELFLAYRINDHNLRTLPRAENAALLQDIEDESLWGEAARLLRGVANNLDILSNPPRILNLRSSDNARLSPLMKNLSGRYLVNVESLLMRKPSEEGHWRSWFFWRTIEGAERPMKQLLERIKPIPPSTLMELLPHMVIEIYYGECSETGNWSGVIEILRPIWEREIEWALESQVHPQGQNQERGIHGMEQIVAQTRREMVGRLPDSVATPLIEAYLNDGKPREAGEIFSKCLDAGLKFSDASKLVDLAKTLGHERLAREWEDRAK